MILLNNHYMKKYPKFLLLLSFVLLSLFLGACSASAVSWPGVTVKGDQVIEAYNVSVTTLSVENGQSQSVYPPKAIRGASFYAPPAFTDDDVMVIGGYNKILYGVSSANEDLWSFNQAKNSYIAGPLVQDGLVYAPNADGTLYVLSLEKLDEMEDEDAILWTFKSDYGFWATPVIDKDRLYLAGMDHFVYCLDAATGAVIWQSEDLGGALVGTPTLDANGRMYIGTMGNEMLALSMENGLVLDRYAAGGWIYSGPLLQEGKLYFGDLKGDLFAVDAQTFEQIWKISLDMEAEKRSITGQPLALDGKLYIGSESGNLFIINQADGKILDTRAMGGPVYASPQLSGDLILVAPAGPGSTLVAVTVDGIIQWSYPPPKQ
jgi:outer membrane protein assembly factor BamB